MKITFFEDQAEREIQPGNLAKYLARKDGTIWVDITAPLDSDADMLQKTFGFHPLAIEDTRNQQQRPKADEFSDHLFVILNPVLNDGRDSDLFRELDVFVGRNYIVSVHIADEPLLERVRLRLKPERVSFVVSSTYLLYLILDEIVDEYLPLLERVEEELDDLSGQVFANPGQRVLSRLFELQQMLSHIGRVLGPQQDVINILMNHQLLFIDQNSQYYLRDISDHLLRAVDMLRTLRDTVNSLLNLYISTVSYQLNGDVNRLTLLAVIVGCMTVISGFYGMNFESTWPPFSAWWGVPLVILMMLAAVVYILYALRRRR